jgi:hypothetical protein
MRKRVCLIFALGSNLLACPHFYAQNPPERKAVEAKIAGNSLSPSLLALIEKAKSSETKFLDHMRSALIVVELWIQHFKKSQPGAKSYLLGTATWAGHPYFREMSTQIAWHHFAWSFETNGFLEMAILDPDDFDVSHYEFTFLRNEWFGEADCTVFQIKPRPGFGSVKKKSRRQKDSKPRNFHGTVWLRTSDGAIVRFQGAFYPLHQTQLLPLSETFTFAFDSTRIETEPGVWKPDKIHIKLTKGDWIEPSFAAELRYSWDRVPLWSSCRKYPPNEAKLNCTILK